VGRALRRDYPFFVWLENTLVIFGGSVIVTLLAGVAAAYASAGYGRRASAGGGARSSRPTSCPHDPLRPALPGRHPPGPRRQPLVLAAVVYPTLALPFCIWILSAYFQNLPREIEESALVEGASRRGGVSGASCSR